MDINTIILVIILAVMIYAISEHLKDKNADAESTKQKTISEKEDLSNEEVSTYGQVQERKKQLIALIENNLSEHPEESEQLKDIIEDWAELKIEAFQNRRSWVRASPSD
ncbi:MAG: hypothetical protein CMG60_03375 [Candidatus Marinimicrobia bacterium]|nr:hypothetical protein [Candidatus Neomarinimicrobiota bacterium]